MKKKNKGRGRDNNYLKAEREITYESLEGENSNRDENDVKIYGKGSQGRVTSGRASGEEAYEEETDADIEKDLYIREGYDDAIPDGEEESGEYDELVSRTGEDEENGDWLQDDSEFDNMEILYQEEMEEEDLNLDEMAEDMPEDRIVKFSEKDRKRQREGRRGAVEPEDKIRSEGKRGSTQYHEENRRTNKSGVQEQSMGKGYAKDEELYDIDQDEAIDQDDFFTDDDILEEEDGGTQSQKAKSSILLAVGVIILLIVIAALCFVIWKMGHREPVGGSSLDGQAALGTETEQVEQTPGSGSVADDDSSQVSGTADVTQTGGGAGGSVDEASQNGQANDGLDDGNGDQNGSVGGDKPDSGAGDQTGTEGGAGTEGRPGSGTGDQTGTEGGAGTEGRPGSGTGDQTGTAGGAGTGGGSITTTQPGNSGISETGQNGADTIVDTKGEQSNVVENPGSGSTAGQGQAVINMTFQEVNDTVTAKEMTNLRSEPSTEKDTTVVVQLKNGQTVKRTGMNPDTGWSRLDYEGQTLYAVSRFLTTDLSPKSTGASSASAVVSTDPNTVITSDGRTVTFTDCDDIVSPKMAVNLRGEPSTAQGNASIHVYLEYRNNVHRTGISEDTGWSRVEYNGEVLYAVTSYLYNPEETVEE